MYTFGTQKPFYHGIEIGANFNLKLELKRWKSKKKKKKRNEVEWGRLESNERANVSSVVWK